MLLAIDTATRWVGLALHDGMSIVAESGWRCLNTHTIELTPAIGEMLARADVEASDLRGIAVAVGPGSYTGLRVGLALAKGLALANQTSLVGVPTLDIVAAAFGPFEGQLLVSAVIGRHRICAATYEWARKRWLVSQEPTIETWESLLDRLDERPTLFAGEISRDAARLIRTRGRNYVIAPPSTSVRRAGFLAELGWRRLRKDGGDDAGGTTPIYLRDPAGS